MRLRSLLVAASLLAACVGDDPPGAAAPTSGNDGPDGSTPPSPSPMSNGDSGAPACGTPNAACCSGSACTGGSQCNGTICVCPADQTACGSVCVNAKTDARNCGRCGHDCFGGTCSDGKCTAYTVTPSQTNVDRILSSGGRLYWTRGPGGQTSGGFFSSKLDGTDLVTVFDAGVNGCYPATTALGKAYFGCANGGLVDIRQCTLPCAAGSSTVLKGGVASVSALAADPAAGTVYYAVSTPYNQAPNGGIFDVAGNRVGAMNQANPDDLVVANGSIFWLNGGTYAADNPQKNGGVKRASLAALATEAVVVTAGGNYFDNGRLAVDANDVYFTGRDAIENDVDVIVANAAATGASPTVFADGVGYNAASDGTNVFFDDSATSSIRYCSRTGGCGGGKIELSPNEPSIAALTVDADSVLWAKFSGEIRRIAKP